MDSTVLNDTGPVNGSNFHPSSVDPSLGLADTGHPMNTVGVPQAVGGPAGEDYQSLTDNLFGQLLDFDYQTPAGLNQYTAVPTANDFALPESQTSSFTGNSSSESSGIGAHKRPSDAELAQEAINFVRGLNKKQTLPYRGGGNTSKPVEFDDLLDANFGTAARILEGFNGYANGESVQSLPNPSYDAFQFGNLLSYDLAAQNGAFFQSSGLPEPLAEGLFVEPNFAPAYASLQNSLLTAGVINNNDWTMGPELFLAPVQRDSITDVASQQITGLNQTSESHTDNSIHEGTQQAPVDVTSKSLDAKNTTRKKGERRAFATRGPHGFPLEDHLRIKNFIESYQQTHKITEEQLTNRIWASERKRQDDFWDQVAKLVPSRTRAAVMRHCRRHFYPFGRRGVWTQEEDMELKAAVEKHGRSWTKVGQEINRHPDDARDRYRNYLTVTGNKEGRWTEEDVRQFNEAMAACEAEMRADYHTKTGLDDAGMPREMFLNADIVSQKMGYTRKRVQVQYRMRVMREAEEAKKKRDMAVAAAGVAGTDQDPNTV